MFVGSDRKQMPAGSVRSDILLFLNTLVSPLAGLIVFIVFVSYKHFAPSGAS